MPRPTIYAVATKAEVSIATVSRVMNNSARVKPATRDKVQQAMLELGYRPSATARGLATQHTQSLALLVPDLQDALSIDILRGIQAIAKEKNYHILLLEQRRASSDDAPAFVLPAKVDGYILAPGCVDDTVLTTLRDQQIPTILLYASDIQPGDSVIVDEEQGAYLATSHLIKHSKRRIACIGDGSETSPRVQGYQRALSSHGLTVNPHLFTPGGPDVISGYNGMSLLLDLTIPPQAVFVASDQAATGALYAIQERGKRVPEDIAVTSYGNTPTAVFSAQPLSSATHDAFEQGKQAAGLLLQRIADPQCEGQTITIETELITRTSCGCKLS